MEGYEFDGVIADESCFVGGFFARVELSFLFIDVFLVDFVGEEYQFVFGAEAYYFLLEGREGSEGFDVVVNGK